MSQPRDFNACFVKCCQIISLLKPNISRNSISRHTFWTNCVKKFTQKHIGFLKKLFALPPAHFQMRRRNGKGDGKGEWIKEWGRRSRKDVSDIAWHFQIPSNAPASNHVSHIPALSNQPASVSCLISLVSDAMFQIDSLPSYLLFFMFDILPKMRGEETRWASERSRWDEICARSNG